MKDEIQRLRPLTDCPLILRPGLFEEYLDPEAVDAPRLIGVIKNSPAAGAGLRMGDRLTVINGLPSKPGPKPFPSWDWSGTACWKGSRSRLPDRTAPRICLWS